MDTFDRVQEEIMKADTFLKNSGYEINDDLLKKVQQAISDEIEIHEQKRNEIKSGVSKCMKDMYCGGLLRALVIIGEEEYKFKKGVEIDEDSN